MKLKSRVSRLEGTLQPTAFPNVLLSSVHLGTEPTLDQLKASIADGNAQIGPGGLYIYHHGGDVEPSIEEWMMRYLPAWSA